MFNYTQQDIDNLPNTQFDINQSFKFIEALKIDDFNEAGKCIVNGADPNFYMFSEDYHGIYHFISFISEFYSSLWQGGKADSFNSYFNYLLSPEEYILKYNENKKEIEKNEIIFHEIKNFLTIWHEFGGDFNSPVLKKTINQNKNFPHLNKHIDVAWQYIFCSLQDKSNDIESSEAYETAAQLLIALNSIESLNKLPPSYNNQNIVGLFLKETWSDKIFSKIIPLVNMQDTYSLFDKDGNTPLHYGTNIIDENILRKNEPLLESVHYYKELIESHFSTDCYFVKNKDNLLPIESLLKNNSWLQVIPVYEKTIKSNPDIFISPEIIQNFIENSKIISKKTDANFNLFYNNDILPFISQLEKKVIMQGINKSNLVDEHLSIVKKRI